MGQERRTELKNADVEWMPISKSPNVEECQCRRVAMSVDASPNDLDGGAAKIDAYGQFIG